MGDETIQFATRFSKAVDLLAQLAGTEGQTEPTTTHRAGLAAAVRDALDAVETVYRTGTKDVRNWSEQRRRVLAQLAPMREALERSGVDGEVRRMAGALLGIIEPKAARR